MLDAFHDNIISEIKDVEARERAACQREIDKMVNDFELILTDELQKLEVVLRKEYDAIIENQEQNLQAKWRDKLEEKVRSTVNELTIWFWNDMDRQTELLSDQFASELRCIFSLIILFIQG